MASTPEQEAANEPISPDDKASISKLMESVPDDGFAQEPSGSSVPLENEEQNAVGEPTDAAKGTKDTQEQPLEESQGEVNEPTGSDLTPKEGESSAHPDPDAPQDDYEREIDAIEAPKGASTKTTEVLKILKQKNREEHRARKEEARLRAEAEKREILDEPTKQELTQLRQIRDELAVEHSPVFQQYTQEVQRHEQDAIGLLKQWKLPDETAKFITDNGGLMKFQASEDLMPPGVQVDGKPVTQSQWWAKVVKPMLSDAQKDELSDHLFEARKALRDRNAAVQKAKINPQEFFANLQKDQDKFADEFRQKADKQLQLETDLYGDIAKPKVAPANATQEQRDVVAKHNARLETAKQSAIKWINDHTPEGEVSKALARVYRELAQERVAELEQTTKDLQAKLNELQDKWNKVKSSKETSRQQSTVQQQKERVTEPIRRPRSEDDANAMKGLLEQVPV
jgi:hypothetical protein